MLQQLRRAFTTITCMLLAAVLLFVQSMSVISSYLALQDTVRGSLEYGLDTDSATPPILGNSNTDISVYSHLLIAKIILSNNGVIISSNSSQVNVNPEALIYIIQAINAGEKSGTVSDSHLIWQSRDMPDGSLKIAIADTTTVDASLNKQISFNLVVFALMMAVIFVASWILSKKALLPVERSWMQQKRFIADASHELKTPLAVILSNTQILMRHVNDLPTQDQTWIRATSEEAQRMKDLVEDLLDLTRSELAREDKTIRVQEDINLTALIERVCLQFDAVAFERGCFIETNLAPNVHAKGDPGELEKLIKILVDNACKYARKGTTVLVSLSRVGRQLSFSVNNQGEPIDPDELPHVFERFFRSDKVRTRNQSGSYGLGLAIAQSITEEHQGKISVTSNAQDGTTFTCNFPRIHADLCPMSSAHHKTQDTPWAGPAIGLLDLDAFFASVEVLDHPEWKGLPVIVGGPSSARGVVSTCSYEARVFGVHSAMSSAEAERLCVDAIWVTGRMERYHEVSRHVMQILKDETPLVQQVSVDEAFFDVTPGRYNREDPREICRRIQKSVSALGISCSIGLSTSKSVSKIASEREKPQGFVVVEPGQEQAFLAPLPTGALSGIGKKTQERLRMMGILTLGQLAAADTELLTQVFGKMGAELKLRASGLEHSRVVPEAEAAGPKSISAERTFAKDLTSQAEVEAALHHLANKVARRLRAQDLRCAGATLKLHTSCTNHKTCAARLRQPSSDGQAIARAASEALAKIWHEGQPVRLLGIAATNLQTEAPQQLELFSAVPDSSERADGVLPQNKSVARFARNTRDSRGSRGAERQDKLNQTQDAIREKFGSKALVHGFDLEFMAPDAAYDRGAPKRSAAKKNQRKPLD